MSEPARLFTPAEANALLPRVAPIVTSLRRAAAVVRATAPEVEELARRAAEGGGTRPTPDERSARRALADASETIARDLRELDDLGVLVKDVGRGLLDFPSERDGELVELCWLDGEPSVAHWHRVGEGFAGRRPLDADLD